MSWKKRPVLWSVVLLTCGCAASAQSQSVSDRVRSITDGVVRFAFATRAGVCGQGGNITRFRSRDRYWEPTCDTGPARVVLEIREGRPSRLRTYVAGHWVSGVGVTDLGTVGVEDAVHYLLELAETEVGDVARNAAFAATLADSVEVWPRLLDIASDPDRPRSVRRGAQEWLGILAAESLDTQGEPRADPDRELREQAVFALTQLPHEEGIPRLVEIATSHPLTYVRSKALFWLGQSGDPRGLRAIADVLSDARNR
jgi:HEAT repeat protein